MSPTRRARRPVPVAPLAVLLAAVGLLISTVLATPGSAATISSGSTTAQHGVNVYVQENGESAAQWQADATNEMKGIKSLDANAVAIAFPFYTPSLDANCVYADTANGCDESASDPASASPVPARVAVLVKTAQRAGLHVLLRPLMDQDDLGPDYWRGDIDPTSRTNWFKSYESMMQPYLEMANTDKVTGFTISLELASLATATQWPSVITWAKKLYRGQMVFATSWRGSDRGGKGEVHAGTSVGMDSYPGFKQATPSWSVAQLLAGLERVSQIQAVRDGRHQGHDRRDRHRGRGRCLQDPQHRRRREVQPVDSGQLVRRRLPVLQGPQAERHLFLGPGFHLQRREPGVRSRPQPTRTAATGRLGRHQGVLQMTTTSDQRVAADSTR